MGREIKAGLRIDMHGNILSQAQRYTDSLKKFTGTGRMDMHALGNSAIKTRKDLDQLGTTGLKVLDDSTVKVNRDVKALGESATKTRRDLNDMAGTEIKTVSDNTDKTEVSQFFGA